MNSPVNRLTATLLASSFAAILLTSSMWAAAVRYDGLYVCKQEAKYMEYLRFYKDGTVISVSSPDPINTAASMLRRGGSSPFTEAQYTITGSRIEFTFQETAGAIAYVGTISANVIDFKVHSGINNKDFIRRYEFASAKVAPDEPHSSVVRPKIKAEGIELGQWITEVVYYDEYQRPERSDLVNEQGVIVARRCRIYRANSLISSLLAFPGPLKPGPMCGIDPTDMCFATDHDPDGNAVVSRVLCLDVNGDVIMDGNKPRLVRSFDATQENVSNVVYNGAFKARAYVKIFPCTNCAKQTGNSKIVYVW